MTTCVLVVATEFVLVEFVIVDEPNSEPYAKGTKTRNITPHRTAERAMVKPSQ